MEVQNYRDRVALKIMQNFADEVELGMACSCANARLRKGKVVGMSELEPVWHFEFELRTVLTDCG